MRDIDQDIRSSLERLTHPQDKTPGTEALWGDLVDRRRKRQNRNRTFAALPLLLVAVLAVGILSTRDSSDSTRSDVAAGVADTPSSDRLDGSWEIAATVNDSERKPAAGSANLVISGDRVQGDDGCGNRIDTSLDGDRIVPTPLRTQMACPDEPFIGAEGDLFWESLGHPLEVRGGELWLVDDLDDGLVFERVGGADEGATGTEVESYDELRDRIFSLTEGMPDDVLPEVVVPVRPPDGWTLETAGGDWPSDYSHATIYFDYIDMSSSRQPLPAVSVATTTLAGPNACTPEDDAVAIERVATAAGYVACLVGTTEDVAAWSDVEWTTITRSVHGGDGIAASPDEQTSMDSSQGKGLVLKFLGHLRDGDFEAAATLWSGYPVSEPNRPISERVHYVQLLAEYPPFARIVASDSMTMFVTPSMDGDQGHVVTIMDPRSGDSPPVAVGFLTGLSGAGDDVRWWIQRLPAIDAAAGAELSDDGYLEPGEQVVVPGLPIEGGVRGFVNSTEVPVEADLENETFTVVVPQSASGDIALTFVVSTPEEPIVRTFAATVF